MAALGGLDACVLPRRRAAPPLASPLPRSCGLCVAAPRRASVSARLARSRSWPLLLQRMLPVASAEHGGDNRLEADDADDVAVDAAASVIVAPRRQRTKNHVPDAVFYERWQEAGAAADWDESKMPRCSRNATESRRKWIRDEGADGKPKMLRLMTCVKCGVAKLCNTSKFAASSVPAEGGIVIWLERSKPGAESFHNSDSNPCTSGGCRQSG